jgi:acetylornithine deacetylase/succinyl-diaminopimelate desuccinylase-like protein
MVAVSLREEVTRLLQELIRLDTVNPPGNETAAAELLRAYLEPAGVACELFARTPERASLVARIPGRDPGAPRLLFLSHTDTVLADPAEWSVDPWSGELRDGHVWGRGALDMKGQVAASAVAIAELAREGFEPEGDLIFAATADEEVGEHYGLSWLCEEHPEAVRATWCVNEGGGDRIVVGGRTFYLCATSEKATSPFFVRAFGRSGHASTPTIADNALVRAARLVDRIATLEAPLRLLPETVAFLVAILGREVEDPARALAELRREMPAAAAMVEPMLRTTIAPTSLEGTGKRNVIPGLCEVFCDCRILPGERPEEIERLVRAALGSEGYELEWGETIGGSRSALHTPLWEALGSFLAEEEPGAALAPVLLPGFTDSHYMRRRFGTICYGFFPARAMHPELAARLVHSADERAAVEDLELGVRCLLHVARRLLGGAA